MKRIEVPHHSSSVNDLNGGIFLLGDSVTREEVIGSDGLSVWSTKAIGCLILQSLGYYAVGHTNTWKSFNPGRDIINARMAIDEHNLIALVTTYATPLPRHIYIDFFLQETGQSNPQRILYHRNTSTRISNGQPTSISDIANPLCYTLRARRQTPWNHS
jgi:hypothetical protein